MPVRVCCPHCRTPCLVAEQHLGVPVQCGRCGRAFTTRTDSVAAPLVRLDIGAASSNQLRQGSQIHFLVRQMSWCNLDERHELAALAVGKDSEAIRTAGAALASLWDNVLKGTIAGVPAAIASALRAAVVVIWDGQVHLGSVGACRIYHHRAGRLAQVAHPLKLIAGDWLLVFCDNSDIDTFQEEIVRTSSSAAHLVECSDQTILAVRCY